MTPYWSETTAELLERMGTSQSDGLSDIQIKSAQKIHGKNILKVRFRSTRWKLVFRQLNNPMVYTLSAAAVIAGALGEYFDASAILLIVILNVLIGFFQESKAEASIHALKKLTVPKARVKRLGKIQIISSEDILPGDILLLEAGDYVVADARIIESYQLSADEAILTGESLPVVKNSAVVASDSEIADRQNVLYAGTAISSGSAIAVVTSIGMNTEIGNIANLLESAKEVMSPLQLRLMKVGHKLLMIAGLLIVLVAAFGILNGDSLFTIFMSSISLAVAAIPEGLPTIVTLALTLAVRRMTQRKALVRNISSVETLGSVDFICTDKTGTLTTGKMSVREVFSITGAIQKAFHYSPNPFLSEALILCNNASLDHGGSGDATELALLVLEESRGVDIISIRKNNIRLHEWSFDSDRKRMSVAIDKGDKIRVLCKGAPETLLPLCSLNSDQRLIIYNAINELSGKGRRVLAFASREESKTDINTKDFAAVEHDFNFLGIAALADPPKEETISSIKKCKAAGIKVVMITGDHPITAKAIADELGIPEKDFDQVMTGQELNSLSFEKLKKRVETTAVYARVTPEHKLKIIEALQANGHVVSMTGDGVNDAPALKKASIGIAMGKAGTEVARQASAMVLTDDNFSTIVSAVEEGRAIFGNIKRTIQYLLSTNLAEMLVMLGSVALGLPVLIAPLSLLWINLVTDGFPSLALAAEPVAKDYLATSLGPSPKSFFDKLFMRELYFVAGLMTIIELSVYFYALKTQDLISAKSIAFTLLVYLCLFRSFSCRSEQKTFFELPINYWHLGSVILPIILQYSLQYTETFQRLFAVRPLSIHECTMLFFIGIVPVTLVELIKIWRRKK
jgi:P-type Ca2+ transporter type 2C